MRAFEDSQQRLGLDHIEILLLHDVMNGTGRNIPSISANYAKADIKHATSYVALAPLRQ